jgi:hypothetical protein
MDSHPTTSLSDKDMEIARLRFDRRHGDGSFDKVMAMAEEGATLQDMGDRFGLGRARMSILFKDLTGQSYNDWLDENGFKTMRVRRV